MFVFVFVFVVKYPQINFIVLSVKNLNLRPTKLANLNLNFSTTVRQWPISPNFGGLFTNTTVRQSHALCVRTNLSSLSYNKTSNSIAKSSTKSFTKWCTETPSISLISLISFTRSVSRGLSLSFVNSSTSFSITFIALSANLLPRPFPSFCHMELLRQPWTIGTQYLLDKVQETV